MTDKKPNNNDIIKALDICSKSTNGCSHSKYTCEDCYLNGQPMCSSVLLQDAIDLHTHQQAEIERLKEKQEKCFYCTEQANKKISEIKSEAYKECLAKVKNYIKTHCNPYGKPDFDYDTSIKILNFINKLAKEMVGDDNA